LKIGGIKHLTFAVQGSIIYTGLRRGHNHQSKRRNEMNKYAFEYWQSHSSMRGDMDAKKFSDVVDLVLVDCPNATVHEIAETINADWAEADHDEWLKTADEGEIASWIVSGL